MRDLLDVADKIASVAALVIAIVMALLAVKWRREDKGIALSPKRRTFMKRLLIGFVALVAVTMGFVIADHSGFTFGPEPTSSTLAPAPTDSSVRFESDIILADTVDLDTLPPLLGPASATAPDDYPHDIALVTFFEPKTLGLHVNGKLYGRDGKPANRATCAQSLKSAKDLGQRKTPIGESFCIRTTEGRAASIVVKRQVKDALELAVVVWEK